MIGHLILFTQSKVTCSWGNLLLLSKLLRIFRDYVAEIWKCPTEWEKAL